jgi:hypothetical protein
MLLAVIPAGPEFLVNTYTSDYQSSPAIALDADGDFVIAWASNGQDGSGWWGVYAQRYNAAGLPQGAEFRANTYTSGDQYSPTLAMDADGDFVIAWQSYGQDGSVWGIYAQRYNAAGLPQGAEFRANTYTSDNQRSPTLAMDADGDFVIAWKSYGQDGSYVGVYAQRYNAAGLPQGTEFRANTYTNNDQDSPTLAMDADGDFVIAWESYRQDGSDDGVYAQRYNAAGLPQGVEFLVNTYTSNSQYSPALALDADGDFVIAWQSYNQDGSGYGVYAQRYNAAGLPQGVEFLVNTYTSNSQSSPTLALDADGDFVIAWHSGDQDGSASGVYAQRYNAAGLPQGAEFRVNTYTSDFQSYPTLAMDADGDFVIAWQSNNQDGGGGGIYAQRYRQPPGSISGYLFNDADGDGGFDKGEAALADRIVFLDLDNDGQRDKHEPYVRTAANGSYGFNDLTPGSYRVRSVVPRGWRQSGPAGELYVLTLAAGQTVGKRNFAHTTNALLSGVVFHDPNGDGVQSKKDKGLFNWRVFIDLDNDGIFDKKTETSVLTGKNGKFAFSTLPAGKYVLRTVKQTGYKLTGPDWRLVRAKGGTTYGAPGFALRPISAARNNGS